MKFTLATAALAGLAAAAPAELVERQLGGSVGSTANELRGACQPVTFIFARGSTEVGNMGSVIGPPVGNGLKRRFRTAVQGVDYRAGLDTNALPDGADPAGIRDMKSKISEAARKCPQTKIVVGGYSQGAAATHQAVEELDAATRNRIVGAVTFGDTRNTQDRGRIPNYPPAQTKIFCNAGDLVCRGTLIVGPAHLTYGTDANAAVSFLAEQIERAGGAN
ncbi:cutinase-like protein 6 [Elsinoe australis]|uniref:Cutinase n=1 Tax=Elsinoe australis TaxID=40998 RepID=A0A4U7B451_9PEZI|nr:cutinase-like protein 6 [Elsinoe australis]